MPLKLTQPHIKSRGSSIYYIEGSWLATRVRQSLGTNDAKEARKLFKHYEPLIKSKIAAGTFRSGTFGELVGLYKKVRADHRFLDLLVNQFGHRRVDTITDQEVLDFAADKSEWANSTKNRQCLKPFMAVCNYGALLRPPKCHPRKLPYFPEDQRTRLAPADDWYGQIMQACARENHNRLGAIIFYMSVTGTRIGEACALEWAFVNWERRAINVPPNITKSKVARLVPLPVVIYELLSEIYERRHETKNPHLVFGWRQRSGVYNLLKRVCARQGVPYVQSHEFGRHAFAERLLNDGANLIEVQKSGAWKSITVLVERYGHLEDATTARNVERSAALMSKTAHTAARTNVASLKNQTK